MTFTDRKDTRFYNFFLFFLSLIGLATGQEFSTNITYKLFSTSLTSFHSQHILINYNPSQSILSTLQSNETFTLQLSTYPYNNTSSTTTQQSLDSVNINISSYKKLTQQFYNFETTQMVVVMRLVYEDVYYLNSSNYQMLTLRYDPSTSVTSIIDSTNSQQLQKQNLTKLITQSLTIEVKVITHHLLQQHFIAILEKQKTTNYMLPFNLISLKKYNLFVNIIDELELDQVKYTNQPFLPTFWNQLGQQVVAMPWLPYFSQCTGMKKRIILRDLLKPTQCTHTEKTKTHTFIQLINPIVCSTKTELFQCMIEQYNVVNQYRQPWFYTNENDIFYLHPYALSQDSLSQYLDQDSSVIGELTTSMYNQRPVLYKKNIGINEKPVQFVFRFDVAMDRLMNMEIVSARLEANGVKTMRQMNDSYAAQNSYDIQETVSVVVLVNYFTDMESFFSLHFAFIYYFSVPLGITLVLYFLWKAFKIFIPLLQQLQTLKLAKLIMVPLIKGLVLSLLTMLTFILFYYFISDSTNFSIIATTFDGDDSIQSQLLSKYNGRVGLTLLVSGIFVLVQGIKQTFKIPTQDQMKIILEDAEEQEELGVRKGSDNESQSQTMTKTSKSTTSRQSTPRHRPLEDIMFGIKTLESRRSALTLAYFIILLVFEYNYKFLSLQTTLYLQTIIWLIIQPIVFTLIFQLTTYSIFKDLIYTQAAMIVYQAHSFSTMILKSDNLGEFVFNWTIYILAIYVIMPFYQIKLTELCKKIYNTQQPNVFEIFLLKKLSLFIKHHALLSYYERGLYYSALFISQLCAVCILPFAFMLIELTFSQSRIFSDIFVNSYSFKVIVMMSSLLTPTIIISLLIIIQLFDKYFDFGLFKTIQLNHFTFRNRKVKWMSDIFRLNNTIADYLKQYENFHYSSQLYFILFTLAIAGITITIGLKIIFQNDYICFKDPAMMFILAIIWFTGDILAMIISFLALKFKFYQKKQQLKMRTKLETISKLLTLKSYTKYLDVKFVKDYFLYNYRQWVMKNIDKILTKEMFLEDNGKLVKKMKFYKNLLKRKNLMKKRQSVIDVQKMQGLTGQVSQKIVGSGGRHERVMRQSQKTLMSQGDMQRQRQQGRMMTITVNGMIKMSSRNNVQLSLPAQHTHHSLFTTDPHHPQVIKIPKQPFSQYAKPILYYWFYTAKQNILLKSLIEKVKQEKLQQVCEFCNMDLDLQNIQKRDFEDLVNQYRVINVGKMFVEQQWVSFYRTHQEFITVCLECKEKKLYLQKKSIKNVKYAKIILLNWLIKCKSQMLHKKEKQNQKLRKRQSVGRVSQEEK